MHTATGDIQSIQQAIADIVAACSHAHMTDPKADPDTDLPALSAALDRLQEVMLRVQGDAGATANGISIAPCTSIFSD